MVFLGDRKRFVIKIILTVVATISAVMLFKHSYEWNMNDAKIPAVSRGNYVVFYEELNNTARIEKIDATESRIYFLYSGLDVVAVYDWTGAYLYSLAFYRANNGAMQMRCDNELLYISDRETYEFVFAEDDLLHRYEPTDTLHVHSMGWFNQGNEPLFVVESNILYSSAGNEIMRLPGLLN